MARDTSFSYAFLILPAAQRDAIVAVWDFCRAVDDAVDEVTPDGTGPLTPEMRARAAADVAAWRDEVHRCFSAETPQTRQGRALQPVVRRFAIPAEPFYDLLDGVEMDLARTRYETFDELSLYCQRVASAVGLICIEIFGCRTAAARDYAVALGLALQLTNIIRDVADDQRRGRVYLPQEDLTRFGVSEAELAAGRVTASVRRLLAFEASRAREFYRRAVTVRPAAETPRLVAAEIMRAVYFAILQRIERRGFDVFTTRVRVPRWYRAWLALVTWVRVRVGYGLAPARAMAAGTPPAADGRERSSLR